MHKMAQLEKVEITDDLINSIPPKTWRIQKLIRWNRDRLSMTTLHSSDTRGW